MRAFRVVAFACALTGALIAACGDDDDLPITPTPDGGLDATIADAPSDNAVVPVNDSSFYDPPPDAGSDAADAGIVIPSYVTQFCNDFLDASLSSLTTCCPTDVNSPPVQFLKAFAELGANNCELFYATRLLDERVHYLPQNAPTCINAITYQPADCPTDGGGYGNFGAPKTSPLCEQVFGGTQQEGQDCNGDQECANALPCQGTKCTRAAVEAGAPCAFTADSESDPGLFAQRARCIPGETCNGQTCVPPSKQGEDCVDDEDCAAGLYCNAPFGGTCDVRIIQDAGGPCADDNFCNQGLSCQDGGCTIRLDAGSTCTEAIINGTQCAGWCDSDAATPGTCHQFCGSF